MSTSGYRLCRIPDTLLSSIRRGIDEGDLVRQGAPLGSKMKEQLAGVVPLDDLSRPFAADRPRAEDVQPASARIHVPELFRSRLLFE